MSRALRRFPHMPQTPTFQTSLQFTMVTPSFEMFRNLLPTRLLICGQVSITSRNDRILDAAFHFLNTCLGLPAVAPALVQHYGRQVLTEVLPRFKGVYPKKNLKDISPVLQKIFMQDMDDMLSIVMDIFRQVRCRSCAVLRKSHNVLALDRGSLS